MINLIAKFDVKPEFTEQFKAALIKDKNGTQQEDGFIEMRLFTDNKQPNLFFSYERFKDQAALDSHMQQPYVKKLGGLIETALQSPAERLHLGETVPSPLYENNPKKTNPEDDIFIIFFIFKIKDGYREKLLKQFETHVSHTRNEEEGNLIFDLYTIDGKDDTLAVYEHWRKESDVWDIHFKQPYAVETGKLMHDAVVGDLEQYMNFVTEIA